MYIYANVARHNYEKCEGHSNRIERSTIKVLLYYFYNSKKLLCQSFISRDVVYNSCMIMIYHLDEVDGMEFKLWLQC